MSIEKYLNYLQKKDKKKQIITKKLSLVKKFLYWAYHKGYIKEEDFKQSIKEIDNFLNSIQKTKFENLTALPKQALNKILKFKQISSISTRSNDIQRILTSFNIFYYLGFLLLFLFISILGTGIYNRFFVKQERTFAYPTNLTRAGRLLSFQGRLTDSLGNPITTATNVTFKLYNVSSGGTALYSAGPCSITPDQDGIFSVLIGGSGYSPNPPQQVCGSEIPASIFTENANIYLGVTVGADSEMTPRQQIANVGYAINAETLQGFPPGTSINNIPFINNDGDLLISVATPAIRSTYTSADFTISSAKATVIQSAGTGDIILQATGSGNIKLRTGGDQEINNRLTISSSGTVAIPSFSTGVVQTNSLGELSSILGTSGYFPKWTTSGLSTTSNIYDNGTNIGIGTTSPSSLLSVGSSSQFQVNSSGDIVKLKNLTYSWPSSHVTNGFLKNDGSGNLTWETISVSSLKWNALTDPDGNLTLNHSTYTTTFNSSATTGTFFTINANSLTSGKGLYLSSTSTGLTGNLAEFVLSGSNAANTGNVVRIAQTGTSSTAVPLMVTNLGTGLSFRVNDETGDNDTTPFVIDASGNVGIGTTSPQAKLDVNGDIFGNGKIKVGYLTDYSNENYGIDPAGTSNFGGYSLKITGGALLAVDSGNVGIGTTNPGAKLDVNGDITLTGIIKGDSTDGLRLQAGGTTIGNGNNSSIYFLDSSGSTRGRLETRVINFNTGNGEDGSLTVSNTTTTINDGSSAKYGLTYLTADASAGATSVTVYSTTNFSTTADGSPDEVLIIQTSGPGAGNYEFKTLSSVGSNTLTFTEPLTHSYDGTDAIAQVVEVPQFTNVTVSATTANTALVPKDFDGTTGGILVFRATGTVSISQSGSYYALISAGGRGFRGGSTGTTTQIGYQGESMAGTPARATNALYGGGGGGTGSTTTYGGAGGGGAHLTGGTKTNPTGGATGSGGRPYDSLEPSGLYFGSGGGGGAAGAGGAGGAGGDGGGIIYFEADTFNNTGGAISVAGDNGVQSSGTTNCGGGGGGGGGGTLWIRARSVTFEPGSSSTYTYIGGGSGGNASCSGGARGGAGGTGVFRVEYFTMNGSYGTLENTAYEIPVWTQPLGNAYGIFHIGKVDTESADVAEIYSTRDFTLTPGEVVSIDDPFTTEDGQYINNAVKRTNLPYEKTAIGIVSTLPGLTLGVTTTNSNGIKNLPIALTGRTPVKITNINGDISPGDPLTSASIPGYAMKATQPGRIIGIALEKFNGNMGTICPISEDNLDNIRCGQIKAFINPSFYDPDVYLTSTGDIEIKNTATNQAEFVYQPQINQIKNTTYYIESNIKGLIDRIGVFAEIITAKIKTGLLEAQDVIINNTLAVKNIIAENLIVRILDINNKIISPVIETKEINLNSQISKLKTVTENSKLEITDNKDQPIAEFKTDEKETTLTGLLEVKSDNNKGKLAQVILKGLEGKTAVVIDAQGNATFSGILTAKEATISGTLAAESAQFNHASISGTLTASEASLSGKLVAKEIEAENINEIQRLLAEIKNQPLPDLTNQTNLSNTINFNEIPPASTSLNELTVTGSTNLYNASIANSLMVGNLLLENNKILSLSWELKLSALSQINLFDEAVIIAKDGTITTKGALIAQGGIQTNTIQPINSGENISILLNSKAEEKNPKQIRNSKLEIKNSQGEEVASIDASGSAFFRQLALEKFTPATPEATLIAAYDNFVKRGVFAPAIETASSSAGIGILPENQQEVILYNDNVSENSLIYITPHGTIPIKLTVAEKKKGFFKVIGEFQTHPSIKFDWLVIN